MTGMNLSPQRTDTVRGWLRWVSAAALFALAPKCLVCLVAYAGLGAALGLKLGGPEFCGAPASPLTAVLPLLALAGAAVGIVLFRRRAASAAGGSCPAAPARPRRSASGR